MKLLIIHQNFPGQFRQLTPYLQCQGHDIVALCSHDRPVQDGIRVIRYQNQASAGSFNLSQDLWIEAISRAEQIAIHCQALLDSGWVPDRILAHSGWGEPLALHEVFPRVPIILWPELWVRPVHGGHGVDKLLPPDSLRLRLDQIGRNFITQLCLDKSSAWVLPTHHQAMSLPEPTALPA